MKYVITYSDPAGGGEQKTATVEGEELVLDESRNHLTVLDADGGLVAGFIYWHSFAPEGAETVEPTT